MNYTEKEINDWSLKIKNLRDLRKHPAVQDVSDERKESGFIFVSLKTGWHHPQCGSQIVEASVKECADYLSSIIQKEVK